MTDRPSKVTVAALQLAFSDDEAENIEAVADAANKAAARGAKIILPPELFEGPISARSRMRRCSLAPAR